MKTENPKRISAPPKSKWKAVGHSLVVIVLMYVSKVLAIMLASASLLIGIPTFFYYIIAGVIYFSLFFVLLKVVLEKMMHLKLVDFGILPLSVKPIWLLVGAFLPLVVLGIYIIFIPGKLVFVEMSDSKRFETLIGGLLFTGLATGLVEEMTFRGILLHSLEKAWNIKIAVIVSSILFGIVHIFGGGLSLISCLMTVFSVATIGVVFSLITKETGVVWCAGFMHAIWNFVFLTILTISEKTNESSIFSYVLETKSIAFTGGDFGIESSVISFVAWVIVLIIALYMIKKDK